MRGSSSAFSVNKVYIICALLAFITLVFDAYLQFNANLSSCGLIYIERITLFLLALLFLIAGLQHHTPFTKSLYGIVNICISLFGFGTALRHVWLQYNPSTLAVTLSSQNYTSTLTYLGQWLKYAYVGTISCSVIQAKFYNLPLASWAMLLFTVFGLISFWQMRRKL